MQTLSIELYSLEDLNKKIRNEVISKQKDFLIDIYSDDMFDKSFNMTRSEYARQLTKDEIIEDIDINNYLYFFDGSIASVITYTGKHERAGESVLTLHGKEYLL